MALLSLATPSDVQRQLAAGLRRRRRERKLSRNALAELTTVPPATIKRFESTGQISLRQFILLWQCVDRLDRLVALAEVPETPPRSIEDILAT
ncbi:MAG: transcriptional regulator [Gammaproteobacteria bacterium]|nr:transcriptional regulator [Gammaproteobacteria bacterium]MDE0441043.1 transcriptional regulator [Gammaproteobacteria bacterium]